MPAAEVYEDNRLPDIWENALLKINVAAGEGLDAGDAADLGRGFLKTILPYTVKDNYDRIKKPRKFVSVTLENDYLKAVILPQIGGRVWSLYDKKRGRDLVFCNPVFQPCNFALRNAWAAGGIEFNVGIRGHSVHTSDTVFCNINKYKDGRETVVIYEYERIRGAVWSVEFCLPDNSDSLLARVKIENASDEEKNMYWWTNIAVADEQGRRTLAPCEKTYVTNYEDGVHKVALKAITDCDGMDAQYAEKNSRSRDYFYQIPKGRGKWIVSADKDGYGLAFTSTDRLMGRKLFVWGTNNGGRNWCEFLSDKGLYYAEIQGGLSYHQFEHIPMPANTVWEWTEAFTPFQGGGLIHSPDVFAAQAEAEKNLKMSGAKIQETNSYRDLTPENIKDSKAVTLGSGWGYIENVIRARLGLRQISGGLSFSVPAKETPENDWLNLIQKGKFKSESVTEPPKGFMAGAYIIELLKKAAAGGGAYTYLQLGTALFAEGRRDEALAAWERSFELKPNAWAARNIAMLKKHSGDYEGACRLMQSALALNSSYRTLIIDCAKLFTEAGKYGEWLKVYDKLDRKLKGAGRIKYLTAVAYMNSGMLDKAEGLINKDLVIDDLYEGELSLEKLWEEIYRGKAPLPKALDFRMNLKSRDA